MSGKLIALLVAGAMVIVEAGRDEWKNLQTKILDQCVAYETLRNQFWSGLWLRLAGYPQNPRSRCLL